VPHTPRHTVRNVRTVYNVPGAGFYTLSASGQFVPVKERDVTFGIQRGTLKTVNAPQGVIDAVTQRRAAQATPAAPSGPCPSGVVIDGECISGEGISFDGAQPFTSTQAGAEFEAAQRAAEAAEAFERQKQLLQMQHEWEVEQERLQREAAEKARVEALKQERLQIFTDLMGKDPVRAVLFAMGVGGETTQLPTERFAELAPLQGATEKKAETEQALTGLLAPSVQSGITVPAGPVTLGSQGVSGLVSEQQAARRLVQGDEGTRKLLASAYGVGGPGTGRAGISTEELIRLAQEVTPTGILK